MVPGVEGGHCFAVAGVFALLALVSGPAHLLKAKPYETNAKHPGKHLPKGYPFGCFHAAAFLPSKVSEDTSRGRFLCLAAKEVGKPLVFRGEDREYVVLHRRPRPVMESME